MALPPLTQPTFLGDRDPMIRDPFAPSTIEPGYIRDSDLGSAFVRYPKAGGRLIEKGIGALMDDPLGLLTGAATGAYDFVRESGDPATFVQNLGMSLGLPIVESGQRLAGGEYPGMSLEEEEEARILDALTVAELIPMVGLGIKGVTGALRRRLRAENPDVTDPEIEAMMAQMELEATRPDPGGADLGPRPAELGLEELPETPLATLEDLRDTYETMDAEELPFQEADYADIDATLDEIFGPEDELAAVTARLDTELDEADYLEARATGGLDEDLVPDDDTDATYYANLATRLDDVLNDQLPRYFGDNDQMTISDALVGIGEDYVAELESMGYGPGDIFNDLDEAMTARGYTADQRQQLMDELFPPVATEPGQPLDPWQFVGDVDEIPEGGAAPGLGELAGAVQEAGLFTDPVAPELQRTPMNQLAAMDFSLTGQDTKLNSRFEEVLLAPGAQKKFKNKQEFINYLTNKKNNVTQAEIQARGIDLLEDGPINLDDPDVRRWVFRDPLKVRILDGADVQYKQYFLDNPTDYRETVITLSGSPFDADMVNGGILGDSQHFALTQQSMGGPELLHMRTGQFDVVDPPTENKGATIAGKTFHVGEIQSAATQNAVDPRKSRRLLEELGNGDVDVGNFLLQGPFARIAKLKGQIKKPQEAGGYQTETSLRIEAIGLRDDIRATQRVGRPTEDLERKLAEVEAELAEYSDDKIAELTAQIEKIQRDYVLPETFYEDTRKLIQDSKLFDDNVFTSRYGYDSFEEEPRFYVREIEASATNTNVDDLGVGSLYQTDRITNIAVKQAIEQAIDSGADFITFNRSDLVQGMTGGKLKGHQEYYDKILPKNVNKLMERLEKEHNVKLPRLEDLEIRSNVEKYNSPNYPADSGPTLGKVKGFSLTPELKEIFKGTGISAYREGGQVKMRSGVMALPGNGVVR